MIYLLLILAAAGSVGAWVWFVNVQRRRELLSRPFPESWRSALVQHVDFYNALNQDEKARFERRVQVFLADVDVTGIQTEVDAVTQALVGASAVIPTFGFDDWVYSGLGEVLIYPNSFDDQYQTNPAGDARTLGMVGVGHLSGVMILSKPALWSGFQNRTDRRNVGIHEFAHLVDKQDGDVDGIPAGMDLSTVDPWVKWVGEEMRDDGQSNRHIDDYAYTNEAEYFAVLSEYFFEAPEMLQHKNPRLYEMLQSMYRQNTRRRFGGLKRRGRIGRNAPCPCGSNKKFKQCCRLRSRRGIPTN